MGINCLHSLAICSTVIRTRVVPITTSTYTTLRVSSQTAKAPLGTAGLLEAERSAKENAITSFSAISDALTTRIIADLAPALLALDHLDLNLLVLLRIHRNLLTMEEAEAEGHLIQVGHLTTLVYLPTDQVRLAEAVVMAVAVVAAVAVLEAIPEAEAIRAAICTTMAMIEVNLLLEALVTLAVEETAEDPTNATKPVHGMVAIVAAA